jgi:hypothetical protein
MPTQPVALEEYKEKPNKFQEKAKAALEPEAKAVKAAPKVPPAWASDLSRWLLDPSGCWIQDPEVMDFLFPGVRSAFGKPRVFKASVEELDRRAKELRMQADKVKALEDVAIADLTKLNATSGPAHSLSPLIRPVNAHNLPVHSSSVSARTRRSRSRSPRGQANQLAHQFVPLTDNLEGEIEPSTSASVRMSPSEQQAAQPASQPATNGEALRGTLRRLKAPDLLDFD